PGLRLDRRLCRRGLAGPHGCSAGRLCRPHISAAALFRLRAPQAPMDDCAGRRRRALLDPEHGTAGTLAVKSRWAPETPAQQSTSVIPVLVTGIQVSTGNEGR